MAITSKDILTVTKKVTKEWTKQRKAEERNSRSRHSRIYMYSDRVNFTDVAAKILEDGYQHASGDGKFTVDQRQFYYACREAFRLETGREISAKYFQQNILVKYMNQNPGETAHWRITASPRGTLTIPNTGYDTRIPCGTIAVEEHLAEAARAVEPFAELEIGLKVQWPSLAEAKRYQGVVYIEKEGFDPQLKEAGIAERFDVAILSCKGQSVTAARKFVDHVCRVGGGVPLFVVHDFDKSGFSISERLTTVSDWARANDLVKYEFENEIQAHDLGLRLADVEKYGLQSERCRFRGYFAPDSIATPEEQAFLRSGRRVELNAFTAPQFIEWLTSKLSKHFPQRLIPDDDTLSDAYRRALAVARINDAIKQATEAAIDEAKAAKVPPKLRAKLKAAMKDGTDAWDKALYDLVREILVSQDDGD